MKFKNELKLVMETVQESPQLGTNWIEFSERHARAASSDFARSVLQYFNSTFSEQARASANINHKDLLNRFIAKFSENFEYEYLRRSVQQGNSKVSPPKICVVGRYQNDEKKNTDSRGKIWE